MPEEVKACCGKLVSGHGLLFKIACSRAEAGPQALIVISDGPPS